MRNYATWTEVEAGRRVYSDCLCTKCARGRARARVWSGRNIAAALFLATLAVPFVFAAILSVGAR